MAGHSKWANIKRRKGAQDKKRGKEFTRAIKEIYVSIKEGGSGDPDANAALRNAIVNAKGVNMPKDTIERAIKKAGGDDAENYEEVSFEGYGPHGIAFFVECTTNNTNRTVASIRSIFSKNNGSLGVNGSVEFMFERKSVFTIEKESIPKPLDELELELIDSGAEKFELEEGFLTIYADFTDFGRMSEALEKLGVEVVNSKLDRIPMNTIELSVTDSKEILDLEEKFEEDEDVQNVYHNLEISEALITAMEGEI
ncbi:YebC/PmpR family DNA-binding transcriptional regulator [Aequorivita capsosiphonis]|uniref:YebC/PmpR family DNA-binding transcriptional regulator n=1 Tax=Aequorivita capsosiphonis TaxID=487317 RepID=UPI0003FA7927|nr:YebC/PmpR family DNA-binding transcriptional regulator [Aequorivita capsosiphonis]